MENEVRFETRCRYDMATLRQVYTLIQGSRRRFMIILGTILLGWSLWIRMTTILQLLSWWPVVLLCAVLLFFIFQPVISAYYMVRQRRKIMNGECGEVILRFSDKEIEGQEVRNLQYYQYEQIVEIRQSRKMWLLMIDRRIGIAVLKEGFSQGQAADFPDFIRSKCPGSKDSNDRTKNYSLWQPRKTTAPFGSCSR